MECPKGRSHACEGVDLRLVEMEWPRLALQATHTEDGRPFVNADQSAPDQRLQRG